MVSKYFEGWLIITDYLWINNPSFKWDIPQCCVIHFPFNFNATASIIRPYYKRRTSNSSLYSWGDLIPQCISELLCLRSLFECYQESRLQAHSRRETKHMSPSCVVTIVEKIPELLFWIFLMGWSTIYLNVDGGAVSSNEYTNLDLFLCSEKLRLGALHNFTDWVNNMVCRCSGPIWAVIKHPTALKSMIF